MDNLKYYIVVAVFVWICLIFETIESVPSPQIFIADGFDPDDIYFPNDR